jgi:peptide chain release factor subunit 1
MLTAMVTVMVMLLLQNNSSVPDVKIFSGCKSIVPPRKILQRFYRCDKKFYTETVEKLLYLEEIFGLVWCTGGDNIDLYHFYKNYELKKVKSMSAYLKNKHGRGGQSQHRFERLIEIQRDDYIKHIGEQINQHMSNVQKLFICGSGHKPNEIQKHIIPKLLSESHIITISDQDTPIQILKTLDLTENKDHDKIIESFYNSLYNNMVIYGPLQTIDYCQKGFLKIMFSTNREDKKLCDEYGTQFVLLNNSTKMENRFIKEFGTHGGILRYNVDDGGGGDGGDGGGGGGGGGGGVFDG